MFMLRIRFDTFCTVPVIASSAPMRRANWISQPPQACRLLACASRAIGVISTSENRPESLSSVESRLSSLLACSSRCLAITALCAAPLFRWRCRSGAMALSLGRLRSLRSSVLRCVKYLTESHGLPPLPSASLWIREGGLNHEVLAVDFDHRRSRITGHDLAVACQHSRSDSARECDYRGRLWQR